MNEKTYLNKQFRDVPESMSLLLNSLANYKGHRSWDRDHLKLAGSFEDKDPFTVILFTEPLASEHWRYKKFVDMKRIKVISELDTVVYEHFGEELNRIMGEYLEHNTDPDNIHLNKLVEDYYPQAKKILRSEYELYYPRSWKKKWRLGNYIRPRIKVEKKRRYEMPEPLCWGDSILPQQFYFIEKTRTYVRGCSSGSGTRENHSYFGLAFLTLSKQIAIPSYIFVYDRNNDLRFVDTFNTFIIMPDSMGSNCHEDYKTVNSLMRSALKVKSIRSEDWTVVKEINIFRL